VALLLSEASAFLDKPTLDPEAFSGLPDSFWAGFSSVVTTSGIVETPSSLVNPGGTDGVDPGS
jgi:hypothetical protein